MAEEEDDLIRIVKRLWRAFEHGGVEEVIDTTDPDVEWRPFSAAGETLHGHEGLRAFLRQLRNDGAELRAHADTFERTNGCVVVSGRLRVQTWTSVADQELVWAFKLKAGRVRWAQAFRSRAEALDACRAEAG